MSSTVPAKAGDKADAAATERKLGGLIAFAVLSSLLASTCCVLPLVLVLAGVTGAWIAQLQALKPFTPYATALAVAAMGWAGWLVLRPAPACALDGASCATTRPLLRRAWLLCALLIALVLGFPLIAPLFY